MTKPTDKQVAALAAPGESWEQARERAERLLSAVQQCVPCLHCDPEDLARYGFEPGWVDGTAFTPYDCCPRCESDNWVDPMEGVDDDPI